MSEQNRAHFGLFQDINAFKHELKGMFTLLLADVSVVSANHFINQLTPKIEIKD